MSVAVEGTSIPRDEVERLLEESAVFRALGPDARDLLCERFEPLTVPAGAVLMRQDDEADALYLVVVGRMRVTIRRDDGIDVAVAERGRGQVLGELALITNEPRSATVTAVRDSPVLRLSTDSFMELMRDFPDVQREITTEIVRLLVMSQRQGYKTSPVVTIAVVRLDDSETLADIDARLQRSFHRLTGASGLVTERAAIDAFGDLERIAADRLASWFAEHEAGYQVVVYEASNTPGVWSDACIRQADLVLLVGSSSGTAATLPIERSIEDRRARLKTRLELVLVHPATTRDPRGTRRFLATRNVDRHHHVRVDRDEDVDRAARLMLGRGIGVVFGGGGARGVAEIGVYRALIEHGVPIDATGGTSIGSLIAGCVARGQDPDQVAAILRAAVVDQSPFDVTFPAVSLASGKRVTQHIKDGAEGLDFEDGWRRIFAVSTNLTTGRVEVHRAGPGWLAIRASFSIPGVFPPVRTADGDLLVDGGLLDNLPVGVMRAEHEGITVIAVDVGRTRDVTAGSIPQDGVVSGWRMLLNRIDPAISSSSNTAGLGRILMRLTELGAEQSDDLGDLYIRPPLDAFSIADFKAFDRLIQIGYEEGNRAVGEWLASDAAPTF
jgi:predicted acylesterase/phospholipase RssA/CRP-like cAMP-binding protein